MSLVGGFGPRPMRASAGPAERTNAGHRLYTEADVARLYQVLALRQSGSGSE
ncbi:MULTISPECIES: MerR family transcriptional regulator [Nocardia]|uniref:MerR family transcriptional regulator n=1 Tax=Nocardia TaxID=1817 RepID=UPI001E4F53AB|nr:MULTISPECIES: MerR family transcriptional regulator [Nocardia]